MYTQIATLFFLASLCLADSTSHSAHHRAVLRKRAAAPSLPGLPQNNLKKGNLAIGFIPGWGEPKSPSNLTQINKILPKPSSLVGTYYNLSPNDPTLSGLDWHASEVMAQPSLVGGSMPAYAIAMGMPNLAYVTPTVATAIAQKMLAYNKQGLTVYLRFAWEMNGDWYSWGQQPSTCAPFPLLIPQSSFLRSINVVTVIQKWQLVTNAVRQAGANKTYMLWSPNSRYGNLNDVKGGWTPYWPGAQYVDLIGLSFYSYGGFARQNIAPASNFLSSMLKDYSTNFAAKYGKAIVLSETAAAYTVNLDTGKPNTGGDSEYKIKSNWFGQLISAANQKAYPYYKDKFNSNHIAHRASPLCLRFIWFEIIKDENASGDSPVRQEDFRCLLGNSQVRSYVLGQLK